MSAVERSGDAFKILEQKSKPYEAKNDNTDEKNTVVINHVWKYHSKSKPVNLKAVWNC